MMEKSQPHCRWKIMKKLIKTKTDEEIAEANIVCVKAVFHSEFFTPRIFHFISITFIDLEKCVCYLIEQKK